jgi:DNA-binding GntR family transcriptional regulator
MSADADGVPARGRTDVYGYVRARILDLRIAPDSKVNIDALARELGVSQTPVREALHQLEGDNLIVKTPGKGYRTTPLLGFTELLELFEFRLLIEPWAARAAAVDRLGNPGRSLDAALEDFASSREPDKDPRHNLITHDVYFHDQILAAGHNEFAHQAFRATHCHLHLFRLYPADWRGEQTIDEHRAIQQAIQSCDPAAAEKAMHDHLMGAYHRFAEAFEQDVVPGPRQPTKVRLA